MAIDQASKANFAMSDLAMSSERSMSEVALLFDVSVRTLRFYEEKGLLHPRREGTKRMYDATTIARLDRILKGKRLSFTLAEIRGLLAEMDASQASGAERVRSPAVDRITRMARDTFGTEEKAQQWLHRPTTALSDLSPMDTVFAGMSGVRKVVDLLNRIDHGLSA